MRASFKPVGEADFYRPDTPKILRPVRPAPFRALLWVVLILFGGTLLGIASAYLVIERDRPLMALRIGVWETDPHAGTEASDPYSAAIYSRGALVPLAAGEGLAFVARQDSSGAQLDPRCTYTLTGETPTARLWTLTATDRRGRQVETAAGRTFLTSRDLLRKPGGSFTITASPVPSSGNWLPLAAWPADTDGLVLKLRLYDAPVTTGAALSGATMPAIIREDCR